MKQKKSKNNKSARLNKVLERLPSRKSDDAETKLSDALKEVPKITDETVSEHREEVLSSARKYIYPLKHSKHNFVRITLSLLLAAVVAFFIYSGLELYYFQSTSDFIYSITEVLPFPVARAGTSWVSYYSYLFELRRNIHYYETQQQANFSTAGGKLQLDSLKKEAMTEVILNAYVKQLASNSNITVSSSDVNNEISLVREENRLGNSNQVLANVLKDYWGWTLSDFKQELSQELLQQAVVAKLDTQTDATAAAVYKQLQTGANFSTEAQSYSDDSSTKGNGGQYSFSITPTNEQVAPQISAEVFKLQPGQYSTLINTGYSLEIVKVLSVSGDSVQVAHIQFNFQPITNYTNQLEKAHPAKHYISV